MIDDDVVVQLSRPESVREEEEMKSKKGKGSIMVGTD
jgi:hypothetical protein